MLEALQNLIEDESAATAVEYGLIGVLVAVAAIGSLTALGESISSVFLTVKTTIDSVLP